MFEDTGKTLRADAYRPVNTPVPLKVEEGADELLKVVIEKRQQVVASIEDRWRIDDEWWRSEPITRFYYAVRLASGQRLVLYKDLLTGGWYRQSY